MLWFYGGDWKEGGESFQIYNGAYFAEQLNMVSVITNYRLGALGFLYPGTWGDPNVGLADQRFALQWVQANAHFFNADPNKVMIAGQSAGGESVTIHMSNPNNPVASMFSSAISESGPFSMNYKWLAEAKTLGESFAVSLGCDYEDGDCFQSLNVTKIIDDNVINVPLSWSDAIQMWAPVVTEDETEPGSVAMQPVNAFARGDIVKNVTFVSGANLQDGMLFGYAIAGGANKKLPMYEYVALIGGIFNQQLIGNISLIDEILLRYPPLPLVDNKDTFSNLLTDYVFLCPARYSIRMGLNQGLSTYLYQFRRKAPFCIWPKSQMYCCNASCHGTEIVYVYHDSGGMFPWTFPTADNQLANLMASYWASIAHYGDPNKMGATLNWPAWDPVYMQSASFDVPAAKIVQDVNGFGGPNTCDFWDKIGYLTEQHGPILKKRLRKLLK